jgi:D-alanyl-D-alanine carboxypeptidase/D-alanyl-D-alanine-endopeptidase (penicillin-binding protein 4)
MKTLKNIFKVLVLLFAVNINFSPAQAKISKFKPKTIEAAASYANILSQYKINSDHVSLQILDGEEPVFALNENTKKIPASISKILTSFAVLKKFPLGQKFYTKLFYDGNNLYLQGGGDPGFVSENLWFLVNEFTRSDIKEIKGNIIVDDSLFDKVRFDESRESQRVSRAYDSPVGAMSFNWNAVNIFVKPIKIGQKARVKIDPDNDYYELVNNTNTVSGIPKKELVVNISNTEKLIIVSGDVAHDMKEKAIFKSISEPDMWSGHSLVYFLEQRDISVAGKVISGKVPKSAELVATSESKNLAYILADMNKFSNNFVAEMLTKNLAALDVKSGASLRNGVVVIREELSKIGIGPNEIIIENPSGLTRDNSFSASALNKVLTAVKNDFSIYPIFLDGLPIAGVDGTLKRRMKNSMAEGWVRAKTGYLDGVVSLAGYAGRRDGKVFTFSFLYNGPRDEAIVREAFDQLLNNSLKY